MIKKNWLKTLPLILLALAIGFSPSFSAGRIPSGKIIEIRAEDILLVILGLVWIANFLISGREKFERPPLFFPILAWLGIGFFSLLTNWIFINITLAQGFFFFLKEVEFFFLYFYFFYHIKKYSQIKFLIKVWIFIGLINAGWIFYQIITGLKLTFYYGPTPFIEPEGPFPAGGFFLLIFIFLFNILLYYYFNLDISKFKKGVLATVIISPAIGVFASGSRASFFGLFLALILTILFYSFKKGFLKSFLIVILLLIFISSIFIFSQHSVARRFSNIEEILWNLSLENSVSRPSIWIFQLSEVLKNPLVSFFGFGKSALGESHSQYVRNFVETGIIGSLIFLILMFVIIKKSWQGFWLEKSPLSIGLSSGLLVATLTMLFISISAGAFIVVKIAEVYWFFTALTMAVLILPRLKSVNL